MHDGGLWESGFLPLEKEIIKKLERKVRMNPVEKD